MATFAARDLTVKNVTVANSFDKKGHPGTAGQVVAVNAEGDRQVYENDRFLGHQDTLLARASKAGALTHQYFRGDQITGGTDFIFGNADAVFDHDTVDARDNGAAGGLFTRARHSSSTAASLPTAPAIPSRTR
ncbi:hypothetical protein M878_00845 [Streptomyces roseochromogenus subsp. oscitans DS 12.976]|uniref:Pectinesterase catalytic domain-containing protein n=1 Tax=Streptomyces roseochromogenus subsp. oscitans DS 12.976 TaxID=1352936 RepID=V6L646_STRRC|nr:hypothetical protein M878_00845 [Streptomyces roseochromogenus subsp. oscitans DS 12.976]